MIDAETYLKEKASAERELIKLKCLQHILDKECAGMSFYVDISCQIEPYIKAAVQRLMVLDCQEVGIDE